VLTACNAGSLHWELALWLGTWLGFSGCGILTGNFAGYGILRGIRDTSRVSAGYGVLRGIRDTFQGYFSRAFMYKGGLEPGHGSYVRPVGITQGAGSVTAIMCHYKANGGFSPSRSYSNI